jgi:hypothetical protein
MAINLSDNILAQTTKPGDAKYGPYYGSGTTAALALTDAKNNSVFVVLINNFRYKGLTVGIVLTINGTVQPIKEYWFEDGIADADLVEKSAGGTVGGSGTVGTLPKWGTTTTELTDSVILESSGNIGIGAAPVSKKLEVDGDFSARGIESIGNNTGITFPAVLGWYRIMEWAGASRGGTVIKLSTTGNNVAPTTYVINAFKTYGDPASTNTLKLEQYGNNGYLDKARIATDSATNITYLEVYLNALGSGGVAVPMMVFHDSLLGYDNNTIVSSGTVTIAPATSVGQEELPFVYEGTSVEKLYAENVNLLNLQVNGAQGSSGDVLTSTGLGVNWSTAPGTNVVANPLTGGTALTTITIGTTNYDVGGGTVGGSGTAGRLPRWSTTSDLGDSSINESTAGLVEVIKVGGNPATDGVLYMDTTNRRVGFRTNSPGAAFDVNGSMRVRNEINVGHTSEQNLFVQGFTDPTTGAPIAGNGYVKMGSYGQGNITGSPTSIDNQANNLRRSAAFGRTGKVVDNYIYDTFEIKISALEQLGTTPLTGEVLVNTPSNLTCLLADFWFYRQINNNSSIGTWGDNTDLVIYPSNDLSGQIISSPYEQGYFRITNDFLTSTATGGKSGASCGLYQGNINGVDQGGMNGAWQIGSNTNNQPLGNKVYLSLATNGVPPTFPANSQTRFFIGLKYRFLSFQFGVVNNTDLITIEGAVAQQCAEYTKCEGTDGEDCNAMLNTVYIPVAQATDPYAIIRNGNTGQECCYVQQDEKIELPTLNHTIVGNFTSCDELPKDCTE